MAMPTPDSTGVPAGTQLRVHTGNLVITRPGTVIDGLDIRGYVDVRASGVIIRNSLIRGGAIGGQASLVQVITPGASLTIQDSELDPTHRHPKIDGLRGFNITANRIEVRNVVDSGHFWAPGNVTIRDSLLHQNLHFENDPGWNGGPSHDDNIQIQSGSNYIIERNRFSGAYNAAIMITQDRGTTSNVRIYLNWIDGGACSVNIAQKGYGPFQNIDVLNNRFDTSRYTCWILKPPVGDIQVSGNWSRLTPYQKVVTR